MSHRTSALQREILKAVWQVNYTRRGSSQAACSSDELSEAVHASLSSIRHSTDLLWQRRQLVIVIDRWATKKLAGRPFCIACGTERAAFYCDGPECGFELDPDDDLVEMPKYSRAYFTPDKWSEHRHWCDQHDTMTPYRLWHDLVRGR